MTHGARLLWHVVATEARAWSEALALPALPALLLTLLLALLLAVQVPLSYRVDVGLEEGYGGDLPLLWRFNTAEDDEHGTYRWTKNAATVRMPSVGTRPLLVRLDFAPVSPRVAAIGPDTMNTWIDGERFAVLPVAEEGRQYHLLIPPHLLPSGTLDLSFYTTTFTPPDDPRSLGSPLDSVRLASASSPGVALPDWGAVGRWLLAVALFWGIIVRALERYAVWWAIRLTGGAVALIALAALLDPPRFGYGAQPALAATAWASVVLVVVRPLLPRFAERFRVPLARQTLGWLLLIIVVSFGLRLGGRLFPLSMWGDIGFHTNRFIETFGLGRVYLVSRNRGVNFPYPPGTYLTLAPLILPHFDIRVVLPFVGALLDGLSAALVYTIVAKPLRWQRTALFAAAFYVFTAAGFMVTWWSFDTHIYTQCASVVLITALVVVATDERYTTRRGWATLVVGVLIAGVFLGHFGFLINVVLMGGLLVAIVWLAAWRGNGWAQGWRVPLLLAYMGAGLTSLALFYSGFFWLFEYQFYEVSQGGLTGLAERAPVPRSRLWDVLWNAGLIEHFGFFPLLLLPVGLWQLRPEPEQRPPPHQSHGRRVLLVLIACSVAVSSVFAVLPFLTLSTQSTRWLMFSAWAVAVSAALAFQVLWRCGRAGRVVVLAMTGYVVWNTAVFWLGPMLWRIRPPEPF